MADYATVADITVLKRALSLDEQRRAAALIPEVCNQIRYEAQKVGKNFDEMIYASELGVQYDCLEGDGYSHEFTLSDKPVSIDSVSLNGILITDYTLHDDVITFTDAPAEEAEILVVYKYRILLHIAKTVTIDVVMRELNTPGAQLPATSYSESAGGISQSFALPNASGRIALWPSDLKSLGLKRQAIGAIDLMGRKQCYLHSSTNQ